jgi:hypothetical protein
MKPAQWRLSRRKKFLNLFEYPYLFFFVAARKQKRLAMACDSDVISSTPPIINAG